MALKLIVPSIKVSIENDSEEQYLAQAAELLKLDRATIRLYSILSKSLDIRNKQQFYYKLILAVIVPDTYQNHRAFEEFSLPLPRPVVKKKNVNTRPLVIGFGPAGMFASLELIKQGMRPIIFERGKKVEERNEDVRNFIVSRQLNQDSNIQFGEGGAGTYSDGKLFSRRNKNQGVVSRFFEYLIEFGAPPEIRYIEKPHLGTDVLRRIVKNIRNFILDYGGEIHYSSTLTDIVVKNSKIKKVFFTSGDECSAESVFLATGHSARDVYRLLYEHGIKVEPRKIMIGLRIEHKAECINEFRYGAKYAASGLLSSATYSLNYTDKQAKTGAYTFCMCPGGEIVNASSEDGLHVVNGMSYSTRSLPFSNGAIVVPCHTALYGDDHPLAGLWFQQEIERKAFNIAGDWRAPAISLTDFMESTNKQSYDLSNTSFQMGLTEAHPEDYLPRFVTTQLKNAFISWQQLYPEFITDQALLIGAETRTSSPVRITRNEQFQSVSVENLYPIGEGAGYAGGITSSAADGIRAVDEYIKRYFG